MRTVEVEVFKYAELEGKARERARDWYCEGLDYYWWDDSLASVKGFCDLFGVVVRDYSIGAFSPSWLKTNASNEHFRGWGKREINALKDKDITGYYMDNVVTSAMIEMFNLTGDAKESFEYAMDKAVEAIRDDMEYQYSEEAVSEMMEANDYEFDQHGNRF